MSSLNNCQFIGRMGRDPEVRMTPSGNKVATFSIACTEKFKDRNGQLQESTEWVRVVVWKKLAEIVEKLGKQGQKVYISGKMKTESWDDPGGVKKSKTEIIANQWFILQDPNFKGQNSEAGYEQNFDDVPPMHDDSLPF